MTVNQQQTPSGEVVGGVLFQELGTFQITSGTLRVVVSSQASGALTADALLVTPTSQP